MKRKRLDLLLMLVLFAVSLAARLLITRGFDGLYGQDAYAYYNFGQTLRLAVGDPGALPPFFWPLGYPALLALGFAAFGQSALTAQAISLLFGGLLAPLVYLLARQIGASHPGALIAGLIMALCGQAIQSSIVAMSDIPALFWATVSAICLVHYLTSVLDNDSEREKPHPSIPSPLGGEGKLSAAQRGEVRKQMLIRKSGYVNTHQLGWIVIAALTLAVACITRWMYLALIPVWGAALLLTWRGIRWRETLAAGAAAALILIPQAAISLHSPYPVLDHAWVEGWSPLNAFAREFENVDGHFLYAQVNALFYAQPYFDAYWIAPLFAPFLLIGLWALRRRLALLLIVLAWALLPYLFLAGIPYQNIRFPLIVVPAVAALAGLGLDAVIRRRRWIIPAAALVIVGLAWMVNAYRPMIASFIAAQNNDKAAVQWAIQHVPAHTRLYTFELTEPLKAYGSFEVHELYDETPESMAAQLADRQTSYLFVNVWTIENQWAGRELQTSYHWLRDNVGLLYIDRIGNYSLFKVENADWIPPAGLQQP